MTLKWSYGNWQQTRTMFIGISSNRNCDTRGRQAPCFLEALKWNFLRMRRDLPVYAWHSGQIRIGADDQEVWEIPDPDGHWHYLIQLCDGICSDTEIVKAMGEIGVSSEEVRAALPQLRESGIVYTFAGPGRTAQKTHCPSTFHYIPQRSSALPSIQDLVFATLFRLPLNAMIWIIPWRILQQTLRVPMVRKR